MRTVDLGPSPTQITRMSAKITEGIIARKKRRRMRRRTTVGASLVAAASLVTASAILATLPDSATESYVCYLADDVNGIWHGISHPMDLEPPTEASEQITWALDLCVMARDLQGVPQPANPVACRLPDLRLGVFPNEGGRTQAELCADLGLLEPEAPIPGYETEGQPAKPSGM